ncbi:hypothetical protein [Pleomorphomonas sp. NRK KF1]|uniref:hypothetical protein n=1 Tax=Pleomorphomonas sp. NRK KF1 TaxID=2943000 RepID=UPI002043358C|nr:hypothetical protein [Pleomorphomonas sp. NRK KF1]MCM5555263.1 hypothetical protein [Pleomorphomonas sp. NRK KF1]
MKRIREASHSPHYIPSGDESDKVFAEAFRRTPEAHAVLSDPARRANYDWFARNLPPEAIEPDGSVRYDLKLIPDGPLHCSRCGRVALQPRYVTLWYVEEVDGYSQAVGREDFLCVDCARDGRRFNSFGEFVSGVLDLFIHPNSVDRNRFRHSVVGLFKVGMGEKHDRITDAKLILHNVRAFLEQGDIRTAYGLARLIRTSGDEGIASEAAQIVRIIDASGADTSG